MTDVKPRQTVQMYTGAQMQGLNDGPGLYPEVCKTLFFRSQTCIQHNKAPVPLSGQELSHFSWWSISLYVESLLASTAGLIFSFGRWACQRRLSPAVGHHHCLVSVVSESHPWPEFLSCQGSLERVTWTCSVAVNIPLWSLDTKTMFFLRGKGSVWTVTARSMLQHWLFWLLALPTANQGV